MALPIMRLPILLFMAVMTFPWPSYAASTSFTCNFPVVASPSGVTKKSKMFEFSFLSDATNNKAYVLGNAGSSEVTAIQNQEGGITFVETTDSGNVMVTAITSSGDAVHSRNGIILGKLIPSQYYGKCTIQ